MAPLVEQLHAELNSAGLRFRPFVYLSYDWFTPDGVVGFAAPFYLAHPRLMRLERRQMLEVEGGAKDQCMRLLRHETAHAFDNAYRLRRKKRFRELFGRAGEPYRDAYTPDPTSRDYVVNLDSWYAQSHPLRTSPRPSPSGSARAAAGASATPTGRRSRSSKAWTRGSRRSVRAPRRCAVDSDRTWRARLR